ncbi:MAG TPA: ArsR family transcriptional regulator [Kiritimatiellia bacterium]|nr:ArsR family transcriptional regulator [Kiritimatiellia bacterium]
MLAGPTRLALLRQIIERPDRCVTDLAAEAKISESRASQELRRLQSRGLVQMVRAGRWTRYRPVTDPKVASAKPLLAAVRESFAKWPDEETGRVARAFGHERRLRIAQLLQAGPRTAAELRQFGVVSQPALFRHLAMLQAGRLVRRVRDGWERLPNPHPLAQALARLLAD